MFRQPNLINLWLSQLLQAAKANLAASLPGLRPLSSRLCLKPDLSQQVRRLPMQNRRNLPRLISRQKHLRPRQCLMWHLPQLRLPIKSLWKRCNQPLLYHNTAVRRDLLKRQR